MPFPNKDTQFQPGQSGNPKGKLKGTKHISTWIQDLLNDEEFQTYVPDARDGFKEFKGAPMKAIVKAMTIKAITGDVKAFDALAKYGYGQNIKMEHSGRLETTKDLSDEELNQKIEEHLARRKK